VNRVECIAAIKAGESPLSRILIALAYYLDGDDPAVAEAAFDASAYLTTADRRASLAVERPPASPAPTALRQST